MKNIFYVYEHWRPDKDACFYVGKGTGNRAREKTRNRYYKSIVTRLSSLGMCVEIRLVKSGLSEAQAFMLERERIAFWRGVGIRLTNLTDGGEGAAGSRHTRAARNKIRDAVTQHWESKARRVHMSEVQKKRERSLASRKKQSDAAKKQWASDEGRAKKLAGRTYFAHSPEVRARMKAAALRRHARERESVQQIILNSILVQ